MVFVTYIYSKKNEQLDQVVGIVVVCRTRILAVMGPKHGNSFFN